MRITIFVICLLLLCNNIYAGNALEIDSAVRKGDTAAVQQLLNNGVNPSIIIDEGKNSTWMHSPLILASKEGHIDIVKLLLKHNADVNYVNVGSSTALKEAVNQNRGDIAKLLIDAGADANFIDENEVPILFWAVSNDSHKTIPLLLKAGADPNKEYNSMFYGKFTVKDYFSKKGKSASILKLLDD